LRVVFAGTPLFAAAALEAIADAGHHIPLVLTQPDRPAGRGLRLSPSAVSAAAERLGIPVLKPATLKDPVAQERLREATPEVMVVAAYGLLLPAAVLGIPRLGCLNIHASLLPRWRGAAPIQRAILAGDARTGISIMQMDAGLDTGPVLLEEAVDIAPHDTTGSLTASLAALGATAIVKALADLPRLQPRPQHDGRATHAPKVTKADAPIDWREPSLQVQRRIRALNPAPGAETRLGSDVLKIWEAHPAEGNGVPGEIVVCDARRLVVACGEGALDILRAQKPGGKPVTGPELARGLRLQTGARMVTPDGPVVKPLTQKT
jgi:methionyl-tRNA formyltransferase